MKKATKIILLAAAVLTVIGVALSSIAIANGMKFNKSQNVTHSADKEFKNVNIAANSDIIIRASADGSCYAVCNETDKLTYTLSVSEDTLSLTENDNRKWYSYIGINFDKMNVVLYLPEGTYTSLSIHATSNSVEYRANDVVFENAEISTKSGDVEFFDDAGNLTVTTLSGEISIDNSKLNSLSISSNSGEIELENVIAGSKLQATSKSGEISLDNCDAEEIIIQNSSGDVEATLLSDKMFDVKTNSGKAVYPPSIKDGGKCTVTSKSGNVRIRVQ